MADAWARFTARGPCPQSDAVLRALRAAGLPLTPRLIASRVCLRESTVRGLLQKLEEYGLARSSEQGWLALSDRRGGAA